MLLDVITCILLLIPISTANRGFTCEGQLTTLSCLDPTQNIESKDEINALWKKASGERVIWQYSGHTKKGDKFKNRTINLNENLSLSIDKCDLSDQGLYIFCLNGKPSCQVKLFVQDSKQCKPKTSTEQSTRIPAYATKEKQENLLQTSPPNTYIRWVVYASPCLLVLTVIVICLLLFVCACIPREEETSKNKSGFKLIHKDGQSNYTSA